MITSILLFAQDAAANYTMQMTETTSTGEISVFSLFMKGGYILIPIVLLSLVSFYLIIKKLLDFHKSLSIDPGLINHVNNQLKNGEIEAAKVTLQHANTTFSRIFLRGISKIGKPVKEIESTLESASNIELAGINRNMGYLGLIAGIAPMLGFIGTISGIIKIFYNISLTDNISIGIISGGLYEKMISSGSGLIVGVIAFTGYHMLNMRIDRFISRVEEEAFEFLEIVSK